mgnify:CR=1 FL=1
MASASPAKAVAGAEITLSATPKTGYHFKEWQVISGGVTIKDDKFLMPNDNVEVKAIFEKDAPPAPTDPAKPSISVTGTYTYNGSEHTANVSGYNPATMDIAGNTATDAGDYTVRVTSKTGKWADGSTDAVTAAWSIGKATQEAPNGLIGVAPTTEGSSDGKITGADTTMEYRAESETIYTACAGIEIENLPAGNYFVRYAEDNNHFASSDAAVTVGEGASLADCKITFDGNGGTPSVGSMTTTDQKLASLPSASRSGSYSFDGWYTEKSGGTKITTDTVFSANTTVYAHWTHTGDNNPPVNYYTLRFETGGGSAIPDVRETYNTYMDLTNYVPTRHGYTFVGWYSEQSLVNKVSDIYLTGDRIVYAGWRAVTIPQTGDSGQMNLWSTALCASFAGCVALIVWKIRRREKKSL